MAWEIRGNRKYYYQKQRDGDQVNSTYIGKDVFGELAARRTRERYRGRKARREYIDHILAIDREIDQVGHVIRQITYATFLAEGFHSHRGQWRKIRNEEGYNK